MKPNPFASLNHLTVPVMRSIEASLGVAVFAGPANPRGATEGASKASSMHSGDRHHRARVGSLSLCGADGAFDSGHVSRRASAPSAAERNVRAWRWWIEVRVTVDLSGTRGTTQ